jgi:hypothetical protein
MNAGSKPTNAELESLEGEAKYLRERHQLYRARSYGPRPTSAARLRDLDRAAELAENRLRVARRRAGLDGPG